jgi:peptide/nickel transport system substrate-binding protein
MRGLKVVRLLAVGLVVSLAAGSCGDDGEDAEESSSTSAVSSTTTEAPKVGGTVTMGVFAETAGLDPVVSNGSGTGGGTELSAIYDVIMRYNHDTKKYEGQTAESLTANADFTEWTLKLRPNIKFSDGTAYEAEAVVFGMQRHTKFGSRGGATLLATIKDYTVVDPLTVRFTLTGPWSGFPYVLSYIPGRIPSPTAVKAACGANQEINPRDCSFNTKPVGAGPFVLDSWKQKESLTLKRNTTYWGGQVNLDGLRFITLNGAGATYDSLQGNAIQVGYLREPKVIRTADQAKSTNLFVNFVGLGSVALLNNGTVTCKGGAPAGVCKGKPDGTITLDTPTADRRVRQAIAAVVDPKVVDQRVNDGAGSAGSEFFLSGPWKSPGPSAVLDPTKAKQLIDEVKREKNWDGTLRVKCDSARPDWPIAVGAMLTSIGLKPVTKNDYDTAAFTADILNNKEFDVACWGLSLHQEAPEVGLQTNFMSTSAGNPMNLQNAQIDAQVKIVQEAKNDTEKKAALDKIQEIWKVEAPSVALGNEANVIASRKEVRGLRFNVGSTALFEKVWLS